MLDEIEQKSIDNNENIDTYVLYEFKRRTFYY